MINHDEFRTLLGNADGPVTPDPLFARRLRKQFLTNAGGAPGSEIRPEPMIDLGQARRNRLVDFAAVAIVVLGVLGGAVGIKSGSIGLQTPTAQAADMISPTATSTAIIIATTPP